MRSSQSNHVSIQVCEHLHKIWPVLDIAGLTTKLQLGLLIGNLTCKPQVEEFSHNEIEGTKLNERR